MKLRIIVSQVLFVLLLSGCAATYSNKKYIDGNTYVSERSPTIKIQVSNGFTLTDSSDHKRTQTQELVRNLWAHDSIGMKGFEANYFNEENRDILLKIKTEYSNRSGWQLGGANFKNWPGKKVLLGKQQMNGRRFDTAIIEKVTEQGILLGKIYSSVYEPQARVTIIVTKILQEPMFDSPSYPKEAEEVLSKFNVMADNSFELVK